MRGDASEPLFSYGMLRLPAVQRERFGRLVDGRADALAGWRLEAVAIDDPAVVATSGAAVHPILVASDDARDRVAGSVLMLTPAELAAADAYEVSAYRRVRAVLKSGGSAWVYVAA